MDMVCGVRVCVSVQQCVLVCLSVCVSAVCVKDSQHEHQSHVGQEVKTLAYYSFFTAKESTYHVKQKRRSLLGSRLPLCCGLCVRGEEEERGSWCWCVACARCVCAFAQNERKSNGDPKSKMLS